MTLPLLPVALVAVAALLAVVAALLFYGSLGDRQPGDMARARPQVHPQPVDRPQVPLRGVLPPGMEGARMGAEVLREGADRFVAWCDDQLAEP